LIPACLIDQRQAGADKKANSTSVKSTANLVYTVTVKNLGPYRAAAVVLNAAQFPQHAGFSLEELRAYMSNFPFPECVKD